MAIGKFRNVKIAGICVALPQKVYSTEELATNMSPRELKKFKKTTGVAYRYLASEKQTTSDLCFKAAEELITKLNVERNEIDALIFVTQNADYLRPSTAIILQERLKLSKDCLAFDINLGCSGYVYGLYVLAGMVQSGAVKKALLLTGDVEKDLDDDYLFGDAGSATLVEVADNCEILGIMESDGSGYKAIYTPAGRQRNPLNKSNPEWDDLKPKMDGVKVFNFTISEVPRVLRDFENKFDKSIANDYDYLILHQANKMILDYIIENMNLSEDRVPICIDKYGNTSSASIPLVIADLCNSRNIERDSIKIVSTGFGVGLSIGVFAFDIDVACVLPIIFTDYIWDGEL